MLSPFGIRVSQSNWKCWIQNSHKYLRFNYVHCSHIQNDQKKLPRNKNHKLNLIIHMYLIMQGTFVQYPSTRIVLLVKCHMMFKHLCVMPHFIRLLCTQCSGRCRGSILGLDEVLCPSHRSTKLLPVTTFPTHWIRIQLDTLFSFSICVSVIRLVAEQLRWQFHHILHAHWKRSSTPVVRRTNEVEIIF